MFIVALSTADGISWRAKKKKKKDDEPRMKQTSPPEYSGRRSVLVMLLSLLVRSDFLVVRGVISTRVSTHNASLSEQPLARQTERSGHKEQAGEGEDGNKQGKRGGTATEGTQQNKGARRVKTARQRNQPSKLEHGQHKGDQVLRASQNAVLDTGPAKFSMQTSSTRHCRGCPGRPSISAVW